MYLPENGQAFKFAQGSAADVGQFIDIVGADVEHGGLLLLREGIQTDGKKTISLPAQPDAS